MPKDTTAKTPTGRKPNPENAAFQKKIVTFVKKKPGITSPEVAERLELGTLKTAQLANSLINQGEIVLRKLSNGVRTYYAPGVDFKPDPTLAEKPAAKKTAPKAKAKAAPKAKAKAAPKAKAKAAPKGKGKKLPKPTADAASPDLL